MSERGSFVTQYVYCQKCFNAAKNILLSREKDICSVVIPHWNVAHEGNEIPIIAGKVGGSYSNEELNMFKYDIIPKLRLVLCHSMRIAVLAEQGEQIFTVTPTV